MSRVDELISKLKVGMLVYVKVSGEYVQRCCGYAFADGPQPAPDEPVRIMRIFDTVSTDLCPGCGAVYTVQADSVYEVLTQDNRRGVYSPRELTPLEGQNAIYSSS